MAMLISREYHLYIDHIYGAGAVPDDCFTVLLMDQYKCTNIQIQYKYIFDTDHPECSTEINFCQLFLDYLSS